MGRKQSGQGKYFYICAACLIFAVLCSCVSFRGTLDEKIIKDKALSMVRDGVQLLEQGDYEAAADENIRALKMYPNVPVGDEALFNMGLIHAHYKNPRIDFRKARSFFERLLRDYPDSRFAEQSRIWINVLLAIEKSKEVDIRIQEMKRDLMR
ncbi:MAG: hypothetical protein RDU01_02350 [Thermodesulfovibrionales bacterium]|nr:hypothetical protein [Thermodesulfovibrionales bacterium]